MNYVFIAFVLYFGALLLIHITTCKNLAIYSKEMLSAADVKQILYLVESAVEEFVLRHELIQENFKCVDPNFDRRLPPVSLLLPHCLFEDLLKQSMKVFVADALTVIHLRTQHSQRKGQKGSNLKKYNFGFKRGYKALRWSKYVLQAL